jgi:hypothetical protein
VIDKAGIDRGSSGRSDIMTGAKITLSSAETRFSGKVSALTSEACRR